MIFQAAVLSGWAALEITGKTLGDRKSRKNDKSEGIQTRGAREQVQAWAEDVLDLPVGLELVRPRVVGVRPVAVAVSGGKVTGTHR